MRPGLVGVGAVFAALAVGGLAALFLVPNPGGTSTATTSIDRFTPAGSGNATLLSGPSSTAGNLEVAWRSSLPLAVSIYQGPGCVPGTPGCGDWQLIANWTVAPSGAWWLNGTLGFPYLVAWQNGGASAGIVSVTTIVTSPAPASLPPWTEILLGLGDAALALVGGILLFLGFFLRGGVFRGPPGVPDPGRPPP